MKFCIATSPNKLAGEKCKEWAKKNIPSGFKSSNMEECDIFISVLYKRILSKEFVNSKSCFNFHPGILPKYRGAGTFSWVLINKEKECGITLYKMDALIDHGPIIDIRKFPITEKDTAYTLFRKGRKTMFEMFKYWFPRLLKEEYQLKYQKQEKLHCEKDIEEAKNLTRFVKAFHFPGKESTYYYNSEGEKIYIDYENLDSNTK